jgi:hypothetical protein
MELESGEKSVHKSLAPTDLRVPPRGRLVELMDTSLPEVQHLFEKGWAKVRIMSPEEAEAHCAMIWDDMEGLGTGIERKDSTTWKKGWTQATHGLVQNQSSGLWYGVCAARNKTWDFWKCLYKGLRPISSFDATSFALPSYQAYASKHGFNKEFGDVANWMHIDQSNFKAECFRHIQGGLALTKLGPAELKTQLFVPKDGETVQSLRDRFLRAFPPSTEKVTKGFNAERAEWIKLSNEQVAWYLENAQLISPELEAGEMILWSSGVAHASAAGPLPGGQAERRLRMSVFVSALPRGLVSREELEFRRAMLEKGNTSGHRVCEPGVRKGYVKCDFPRTGQTYGSSGHRVPWALLGGESFARRAPTSSPSRLGAKGPCRA